MLGGRRKLMCRQKFLRVLREPRVEQRHSLPRQGHPPPTPLLEPEPDVRHGSVSSKPQNCLSARGLTAGCVVGSDTRSLTCQEPLSSANRAVSE